MRKIKNIFVFTVRALFKMLGYDIKKINGISNDLPMYIRLYGEESVKKRRFYNISAGAYLGFGGGLNHPCWTRIDVNRSWGKNNLNATVYDPDKDIVHDVLSLQPIPVENSVAELVHTRFTIASISDEAAQYMFNEVFRMLKNGGIFRISTPNIELDYRAYLDNDRSFFYWFGKDSGVSLEQAFLFHVASQLSEIHHDGTPERISDSKFNKILKSNDMDDALDFFTSKCSVEVQKKYRQDHINWWTPAKLSKMLSLAGFKLIYRSMPGQSASPVMRNELFFDNYDNRFVMYMEAVKI